MPHVNLSINIWHKGNKTEKGNLLHNEGFGIAKCRNKQKSNKMLRDSTINGEKMADKKTKPLLTLLHVKF